MILRMRMILTAWSCSTLASGDWTALDQFDRVFSGFSIFDWALDQLKRLLSPLPAPGGLPFNSIFSDLVLFGLSKLNLALTFLSGLAITLYFHFWKLAVSLFCLTRPWPWPVAVPFFVPPRFLWSAAYPCTTQSIPHFVCSNFWIQTGFIFPKSTSVT